MKNIINNLFGFFALLAALTLFGCEKLLNKPSDKSLVIPSTLDDLQALIDRPDKSLSGYPGSGEESSDDYYLTDDDYRALNYDYDQRRYRWESKDIFDPAGSGNEWYWGYFAIYGSNAVLDFIKTIPGASSSAGNYVKGQALLWRGFHYFEMAQIWTLPYNTTTAATDLGLPLRLDPDFNIPSVRSTLVETYEQIFADLKASVPLLITNPISPVRASREGAYGVLARACLAIRDYEQAGLYADSCIAVHDQLLDFNDFDANDGYPIKAYNEETILFAGASGRLVRPSIAKINPEVYNLYVDGDLRKEIFFSKNTDGSYRFRGGFWGSSSMFRGITTAEMYLIRAESYARKGQITNAMNDLNTLLRSRWNENVPFVPYAAGTSAEALDLVLQERRKELIMRGLRWMDIRRLNQEGANIIQTRTVEGQTYTLAPNDLRYALALPEDIIERSDMPQNPR